jgi:dienelactone hydrolase
MAPTLTWRDAGTTEDGVLEREFTIQGERDVITGLMWSPPSIPAGSPLVLIGHGGGGHKRAPSIVPTGRGFVTEHGITAVAIDAPGHGERGGAPGRSPEYYALWKDAGLMTRNATADWKLVLDALLATGSFDPERVGWSGMSMGSLIGIPHVAAEPRFKVAALGLCGLKGDTPSRGSAGEVLAAAAPNIRVPVIYMVQWDDERFERQSSFDLFGLIGSTDKRLHLHLGAHAEMPEEGRKAARVFVAQHLKA